jgi:Transposase domain (DUF772)
MTDDFFRARLDQMIDLKHPLAVLANRMPWAQLETALAPALARKNREGKIIEDGDLFGPTLEIAGSGTSAAGRPRLSIRLMSSLLYLKHAFNLSDEDVVARWAENVVWQYFSGQTYYEPKLPCEATQVGRFRNAIGEAGVEELLKATIDAAITTKAIRPHEFERVGARTFPGNPYDGHILNEQLEQTSILLEDVGRTPKEVVVDLGFRGVDKDNPNVDIIHRGKYKSLTQKQRRWLKRRQAVEPAIGHLKSDNRMDRCWLQGTLGDALHAVLCAAGYNLRWLLRAMVRLGLAAVFFALKFLYKMQTRVAHQTRNSSSILQFTRLRSLAA